jgi:hypothetical protein
LAGLSRFVEEDLLAGVLCHHPLLDPEARSGFDVERRGDQ